MTLKLNTKSDTKDKVGTSWPDSPSSIPNESDAAILSALDSKVVTFIHVVDKDHLPTLRQQDDSQEGEETYASDTSEEEFTDPTLPNTTPVPRSTQDTDDSDESEEEEFEFS